MQKDNFLRLMLVCVGLIMDSCLFLSVLAQRHAVHGQKKNIVKPIQTRIYRKKCVNDSGYQKIKKSGAALILA
jgi:hypothetical protein